MTKRPQRIALSLSIAAVVIAVLWLSGCAGPANHPPTVHVVAGQTGTIWGYALDAQDDPIPGAIVAVSDGQTLYSATSGADGFYRITGVPVGARVVSFDANGFRTTHEATVLSSSQLTVQVDGVLETAGLPCPENLPTVTIEDVITDEDACSTTVEGTTSFVDSDTMVAVLNGQEQIIGLNGDWEALLFLASGQNTIVMRVSNCRGNTLSDPVQVECTAGFIFRVTLTWDELTDIDLHTWGPGLSNGVQHSAYWNAEIDAGELDVDNTEGFGPENFTARTLIPGRYAIGVNFYDYSDFTGPTGCTIRVLVPGETVVNFGPHTLATPNYEGGYPVTVDTESWWRPVDIIVAANGDVSLVAPDTSIPYQEASTSSLGLSLPVVKPRAK